jgi:hypothetical protein
VANSYHFIKRIHRIKNLLTVKLSSFVGCANRYSAECILWGRSGSSGDEFMVLRRAAARKSLGTAVLNHIKSFKCPRNIPRGHGEIRSIKLLTCFRPDIDFPLISLLNDVISNA